MADLLRRSLAPIPDEAWAEIDDAAKRKLTPHLSARGVVDFVGPQGMDFGAVNLGRVTPGKKAAGRGVAWGVRDVLPLIEARAGFQLDLTELQNLSRGAKDVDFAPVEEAAREIASFEESLVYKGLSGTSIDGIGAAATTKPVSLGLQPQQFTQAVADGVHALQIEGIGGPYALVLGTKAYQALSQVMQSGQPLRQVVERLTEGAVVWSPVLDGGLLISTRGGDYELTIGQDLSIGYDKHAGDKIDLFIMETLAFRVLEPAAAVELKVKGK